MIYNPVGLLDGTGAKLAIENGKAQPLAGGTVAFTHCEVLDLNTDRSDSVILPSTQMPADLTLMTSQRQSFASHNLSKPLIMGVINVTPDSFSDGGDYAKQSDAINHVFNLVEAGADIIDIGGVSTRPGSSGVGIGEECARILPVIKAAVDAGVTVSVDSSRGETLRAAMGEGASIVNDVTALTGDPGAMAAVADTNASVVLMHMQGTPKTMQSRPSYRLASYDVFHWLKSRVDACLEAGIALHRIAVDPGIGFGKTDLHNMELLDRVGVFHGLGCAVMIGVSRKSFIGRIANVETPKARLPGTLAATAIALSRGVQIHRVHDVAAVRQAFAIWNARNDKT